MLKEIELESVTDKYIEIYRINEKSYEGIDENSLSSKIASINYKETSYENNIFILPENLTLPLNTTVKNHVI